MRAKGVLVSTYTVLYKYSPLIILLFKYIKIFVKTTSTRIIGVNFEYLNSISEVEITLRIVTQSQWGLWNFIFISIRISPKHNLKLNPTLVVSSFLSIQTRDLLYQIVNIENPLASLNTQARGTLLKHTSAISLTMFKHSFRSNSSACCAMS